MSHWASRWGEPLRGRGHEERGVIAGGGKKPQSLITLGRGKKKEKYHFSWKGNRPEKHKNKGNLKNTSRAPEPS